MSQKKKKSKGQTNYKRGVAIEYKVVNLYREKGYTAQRAAGSHSPVDVFAWNDKEFVLIQCKRSKTDHLGNDVKEGIEKLKSMPCPSYIKKKVMVWIDRKGFSVIWEST